MKSRSVPRSVGAALAATALAVLAGCGGGDTGGDQEQGGQAGGGTLTVFAAASLTGTFEELEQRFEAANPGTDVVFNFAGSSALAQQINQGAPADVFASADQNNMTKVTDADKAEGAPVVFATNTLQIAVAPQNPKAVASLQDLVNPDLRTVVCAPQVPCGSATEKIEQAAGVDIPAVSEEQDVKSVLQKVTTGNADAGLVYRTDVTASNGQAQGVDFDQAAQAVNEYPIAVLRDTQNQALAQQWVDYVNGDEGRQVLEAAGFGAP
ncbi:MULTISPECIES: molybdate ABC transporter substrate-binding protein [Pseudonocardia]|uniref:Molybdate-binding protein ModA n=2 Tax=Pseudonocardia TaxID=1847 RepID=A0A1Y2MZN3_PSEAH|nr:MULTISPECIES: molybdate ABC transporter substrate-binding protein [Pseudonocardia]OSY40108.1 Molybdate-binding periplasmic protein precursor [Pseudonocardia autotrophica]TDN72946.1 molybdate transport system substrate-binding protein [Pseudonocardia autotrophica]BBG03666.1 molybdate-binding protein [Pseudonocardia autotrophica]GEC26364.1 molybdate-binding protein [Pseudonocardia saturnea]